MDPTISTTPTPIPTPTPEPIRAMPAMNPAAAAAPALATPEPILTTPAMPMMQSAGSTDVTANEPGVKPQESTLGGRADGTGTQLAADTQATPGAAVATDRNAAISSPLAFTGPGPHSPSEMPDVVEAPTPNSGVGVPGTVVQSGAPGALSGNVLGGLEFRSENTLGALEPLPDLPSGMPTPELVAAVAPEVVPVVPDVSAVAPGLSSAMPSNGVAGMPGAMPPMAGTVPVTGATPATVVAPAIGAVSGATSEMVAPEDPNAPLTPAAPVPGSIGSAVSGPAAQSPNSVAFNDPAVAAANSSMMGQTSLPAKKQSKLKFTSGGKMNKTTLILLCVVAAMVIIALVVVLVVQLNS